MYIDLIENDSKPNDCQDGGSNHNDYEHQNRFSNLYLQARSMSKSYETTNPLLGSR